jgi:hypothetical protein
MTRLRTFRVDGNTLEEGESAFLAKVEDDNQNLVGTFAMTGEGIFYYRPGSWIITPKEKTETLETYDGYMPFETLKEIFDTLSRMGWDRQTLPCISVRENRNKIELAMVDTEE